MKNFIINDSPETKNAKLMLLLGKEIEKNIDHICDRMFVYHFSTEFLDKWKVSRPSNGELNELKRRFLKPLLKLLSNYLKSLNEALRAIYLDERLRYAPHRLSFEQRLPFLKSLIESDIDIIASIVKINNKSEIISTLINLHSPLIYSEDKQKKIKILAVGDCLMNEVRVFTPLTSLLEKDIFTDFRCLYFSAKQGHELSIDNILLSLESDEIDLLSFSFFSFEALPGYSQLLRGCNKMDSRQIDSQIEILTSTAEKFLNALRAQTQIPFLVHTASGLPLNRLQKLPLLPALSKKKRKLVTKLSEKIIHIIENIENSIVIDELSLVEKYGIKYSSKEIVSQRSYKGMFHTSQFGIFLARIYSDIAFTFATLSRTKLLLVDFDNTLWKGVMADGKVTQYKDRQLALLKLKKSGILLAAVSKNSYQNIRWNEMLISEKDFVALKINWNPKAQSIQEIGLEINLGIDSFVLLDDSPQERALVRSELPQVSCLDPNVPKTWEQLHLMFKFPCTKNTDEAEKRTRMYQEQAKRSSFLKESLDYPSMMKSLGLKCSIMPAKKKHLNRIYELVGRTNQFNTTTIRYSKKNLENMLEDPSVDLFITELSDNYGSMGIVSVVILKTITNSTIEIDSFILSCRAMGFSLENKILHTLAALCSQRNIKTMEGKYIETNRNEPCKHLYDEAGFKNVGDNKWLLNSESFSQLADIKWINLKNGIS